MWGDFSGQVEAEKFSAKIADFEKELEGGGFFMAFDVTKYCHHMARFMSEKAIHAYGGT